ncbi:MAG: hypothetical protein M0036_10240 [Desulfobacteraceae bacterium]|nr:hypothetical protein [Desulfobacteraceae bacterium]
MKRNSAWIVLLLAMAVLLAATLTTASAATTCEQSNYKLGGFDVARLTCTADGTGGAVTNKEINLAFLTSAYTKVPVYFYMVHTTPGTAAGAPDAYTVDFDDDTTAAATNGSICALSARSATLKEFADAAEDLPNYWPVIGNLYMDVGDIGAGNSTTIDLIFLQ